MIDLPDVNFCKALLFFTDVELIPPQRPLSEEIVTMTFFLTSTPRIATQGKIIRATNNKDWKICIDHRDKEK